MRLRKIKPASLRTVPVETDGVADGLDEWLVAQGRNHNLDTMLAHADDGVLWGKMENGELITSADVFPEISPPLRAVTVQQARLFSEDAELLLWRVADGWRARLAEEAESALVACYDEAQFLWGDRLEKVRSAFTLVREGQEGLRHAPPLAVPDSAFEPPHHPLRLGVRTYLKPDPASGLMEVVLNRLTSVSLVTPNQSEEVES